MKLIKDTEFGGERPLFESHDLRLENVIIRAGESAIKECSNIEAFECRFEGNLSFLACTRLQNRPLLFSMSEAARPCGIVTT